MRWIYGNLTAVAEVPWLDFTDGLGVGMQETGKLHKRRERPLEKGILQGPRH